MFEFVRNMFYFSSSSMIINDPSSEAQQQNTHNTAFTDSLDVSQLDPDFIRNVCATKAGDYCLTFSKMNESSVVFMPSAAVDNNCKLGRNMVKIISKLFQCCQLTIITSMMHRCPKFETYLVCRTRMYNVLKTSQAIWTH
jgi:hypothetical protein